VILLCTHIDLMVMLVWGDKRESAWLCDYVLVSLQTTLMTVNPQRLTVSLVQTVTATDRNFSRKLLLFLMAVICVSGVITLNFHLLSGEIFSAREVTYCRLRAEGVIYSVCYICTDLRYAVARCPSICLSRSCILSRRLKLSSNFFVNRVAPSF